MADRSAPCSIENGLQSRPLHRHQADGLLILGVRDGRVARQAGGDITIKRRLQPGKTCCWPDLTEGRIVSDKELKSSLYGRNPYQLWLKENQIHLRRPGRSAARTRSGKLPAFLSGERAFGYTDEDIRLILGPMADQR